MTNLIKNYLPVRLSLPSPINPSMSEDTFLFIKQHIASGSGSGSISTLSSSSSSSQTLFVANAPFYPNVQTSILLQSIFERYGDVDKVVVAPHPRKNMGEQSDTNTNTGTGTSTDGESQQILVDATVSIFEREIALIEGRGGTGVGVGVGRENNHYQRGGGGWNLDERSWYDQGRFAHVVFSSPRVMKKVWSLLNNTEKKKQKKNNKKKKQKNQQHLNNVTIKFGKLEMQELEDISLGLYEKERMKYTRLQNNRDGDGDNGEDSNHSEDEEENQHHHRQQQQEQQSRALPKLIQAKKDSIPSRETLKMACEQIMAKFEAAEEEAMQKQLAAKDQPDDDGFVTVSYGTNVGDIIGLEEHGTLGSTGAVGGRQRKEAMRHGGRSGRGSSGAGSGSGSGGRSRSRSSKKNVVKGSNELKDFYRFQLKESKKRSMEDLKTRFQEDLKRVKRMKEDKMFRPF